MLSTHCSPLIHSSLCCATFVVLLLLDLLLLPLLPANWSRNGTALATGRRGSFSHTATQPHPAAAPPPMRIALPCFAVLALILVSAVSGVNAYSEPARAVEVGSADHTAAAATSADSPSNPAAAAAAPSLVVADVRWGNSLCDRLVNGANLPLNGDSTIQTLTAIMNRTLTTLQSSGLTGGHFNGARQYRYAGDPARTIIPEGNLVSPDYSVDTVQRQALLNSFVRFFAQANLLGCSYSGSVGAYTGSSNLWAVHRHMNISQREMSEFSSAMVGAAREVSSVSQQDADAIAIVLQAFGRNALDISQQVCSQPDCACSSAVTGVNCDVPGPDPFGAATRAASIGMLVAAATTVAFALVLPLRT